MNLKSKQLPLVLKPLEALLIKTEPFSKFYLSTMSEPDQNLDNFIPYSKQFYIFTGEKYFLCDKRVLFYSPFPLKNYVKICTKTTIFNGKIYNENCKYVITYKYLSKTYTTFLLSRGRFSENLSFTPYNPIPYSETLLSSAESIGKLFKELKYDTVCEGIHIHCKSNK